MELYMNYDMCGYHTLICNVKPCQCLCFSSFLIEPPKNPKININGTDHESVAWAYNILRRISLVAVILRRTAIEDSRQ